MSCVQVEIGGRRCDVEGSNHGGFDEPSIIVLLEYSWLVQKRNNIT